MAAYIYELDGVPLKDKSMSELLLMVENLFNERDEYNKGKGGFDMLISRNNSNIMKYFDLFNEVKKCVEEQRFTDGMEQSIKLKLHMVQSPSIFNILVGDYCIANLFGAMTRLITSTFFNVLEKIENQLKLENKFPTLTLIEG